MNNDFRKFIRFNIKFFISSNEITGKGVNISKGGFGFFTDDELVPADNIPFKAEISGEIFGDKVFAISGTGNLLFSQPSYESGNLSYYNGFEILKLKENTKENFNDLLKNLENYGNRK
jgi:hypothetical protein